MRIRDFVNESYHLKKLGEKGTRALQNISIYREFHYRAALRRIKDLSESLLPVYLYIETTNVCNSKCTMCPHSQMQRPRGYMDKQLFKKIVDDAVSIGIKVICLSFFGEPLLDRNLFERIKYIKSKDKNIKVFFNTNASLLSEDKSKMLIEFQVDEIRISFDAFEKCTYEKIRVGLSYDKVISNIKKIIVLKEKMKSLHPIIRLAYVDFEANHSETRSFYDYWKQKVDKVEIDFAGDWASQKEVKSDTSLHLMNIPEKNPCDSLWRDFVILFNGRVSLCCNDYEGKVIVGDLTGQGIMEVYGGNKFRYYRGMHMNNRRKELLLCNQCQKYSFWW